MGKMKFLVVHCSDTPFNREVTPDDIAMWHLGMLVNADKTVTYLGKQYANVKALSGMMLTLPSGKQVPVTSTNGRGWSKVGYSDLINRAGKWINLVPYNADDILDSKEITNGAAGYNSESRHVVLAGGWSATGDKDGRQPSGELYDIETLYTPEQIAQLKKYIEYQVKLVPTVKVVAHNNLSTKTCPNFDVKEWWAKVSK